MKTAELTGALLDYWVARAEGVSAEIFYGQCVTPASQHHDEYQYKMYRPSFDWAQGGPLIEKYKMSITDAKGTWFVGASGVFLTRGSTPLVAICRAVVRAAFGDEVEEVAQ
jgi:hypothetical protein